MSRFFLDEHVGYEIAGALRALGHDVEMTEQAARKSEQDFPQLAYATSQGRIVVTANRNDFRKHDIGWPEHAGIISYTLRTPQAERPARIDEVVRRHPDLNGTHVRVNRDHYVVIARNGLETRFEYRDRQAQKGL